MFARALTAFLVLPGIAAGLAPWVILQMDPWRRQGISAGIFLPGIGLLVLLWCVRDFYVSGKGTLAPWSPPRHLVTIGLYKHIRNPMYVGVLLIIAGWSLTGGSLILLAYAVLLGMMFHLRVRFHEEPWAAKTFPSDWAEYSGRVPRWIPRFVRKPGQTHHG